MEFQGGCHRVYDSGHTVETVFPIVINFSVLLQSYDELMIFAI